MLNYLKRHLISRALIVFVGMMVSGLVYAGPGHDHGSSTDTVQSRAFFPRFYADSEQYEVVGIVKEKLVEVYADQFLTGRPVLNADIEVNFGGQVIKLSSTNSGTYEGYLTKSSNSNSIAVTLTIKEGDAVDIVATTFNGEHIDRGIWNWQLALKLLISILLLASLGCLAFKYRHLILSKYKETLVRIKERK